MVAFEKMLRRLVALILVLMLVSFGDGINGVKFTKRVQVPEATMRFFEQGFATERNAVGETFRAPWAIKPENFLPLLGGPLIDAGDDFGPTKRLDRWALGTGRMCGTVRNCWDTVCRNTERWIDSACRATKRRIGGLLETLRHCGPGVTAQPDTMVQKRPTERDIESSFPRYYPDEGLFGLTVNSFRDFVREVSKKGLSLRAMSYSDLERSVLYHDAEGKRPTREFYQMGNAYDAIRTWRLGNPYSDDMEAMNSVRIQAIVGEMKSVRMDVFGFHYFQMLKKSVDFTSPDVYPWGTNEMRNINNNVEAILRLYAGAHGVPGYPGVQMYYVLETGILDHGLDKYFTDDALSEYDTQGDMPAQRMTVYGAATTVEPSNAPDYTPEKLEQVVDGPGSGAGGEPQEPAVVTHRVPMPASGPSSGAGSGAGGKPLAVAPAALKRSKVEPGGGPLGDYLVRGDPRMLGLFIGAKGKGARYSKSNDPKDAMTFADFRAKVVENWGPIRWWEEKRSPFFGSGKNFDFVLKDQITDDGAILIAALKYACNVDEEPKKDLDAMLFYILQGANDTENSYYGVVADNLLNLNKPKLVTAMDRYMKKYGVPGYGKGTFRELVEKGLP